MYPVLSNKNVLIEGELALKGKLLQQNRYGVLFDDLFVLFKTQSDWTKKEKPVTLIPTEAISMVKLDKDNCLELVFSIGLEANAMTLALPSLTARQWSECLTRIKERYSTPDRERLLMFKYHEIMAIPKFWGNVADIALANYDANLCVEKLPVDNRGNIDFDKLETYRPQLEARRKSIVFSGILRKRSPKALFGQAVLQERYFELYPHVLVYHKKKEEPILGLIVLSTLVDVAADDDTLVLTIQQKTKTRTMSLQCASPSEAVTWRDYIIRAKANHYDFNDVDPTSKSGVGSQSHGNHQSSTPAASVKTLQSDPSYHQYQTQVSQSQIYRLDEEDDILSPMPSMEMSHSFMTTSSFTSVGEKRENLLAASSHLAPETRVIRRPPPRGAMGGAGAGASGGGSASGPFTPVSTTTQTQSHSMVSSPTSLSTSSSSAQQSQFNTAPTSTSLQTPIMAQTSSNENPPALPPKNNNLFQKSSNHHKNLFQQVKKMQTGGSHSTPGPVVTSSPSEAVTGDDGDGGNTIIDENNSSTTTTTIPPSHSFSKNAEARPLGDRSYFDQHDNEHISQHNQDHADATQMKSTPVATIRGLVSKKKRRYVKDGFDLDLTYVTPHIIAMGFPSEGHESLYRNKMSDVQQFLQTKHPHKHKVYNLCSERDYPPDRFYQCARYPFDDHNPCSIRMLLDICRDAAEFLGYHTSSEAQRKTNQGNVVVIHCKAGKGRTGLVVASLLMYMHHPRASSAHEALQFYGEQRTYDGKGVTIPSQIRFVHFFEMILQNYTFKRYIFPSLDRTVVLTSIKMSPKIDFDAGGGSDPYFILNSMRRSKKMYSSLKDKNAIITPSGHWFGNDNHTEPFTITNISVPLNGEVLFIVKDQDRFSKNEIMCRFWIQTSFIAQPTIVLKKCHLDKAVRDTKCSNFPDDFYIELSFKSIHDVDSWPGHVPVDNTVINASIPNIDACGTGQWLSPPIGQPDDHLDHNPQRLQQAKEIIAGLCHNPGLDGAINNPAPDSSVVMPAISTGGSSTTNGSTTTTKALPPPTPVLPPATPSLSSSPPPVPLRTPHLAASPRATAPPPLPPRSTPSMQRKLDGSYTSSTSTSFTLNSPSLGLPNQSDRSFSSIRDAPTLSRPDDSLDVIRSAYPLDGDAASSSQHTTTDACDDDDDDEFNPTHDDLIITRAGSEYDDVDEEDYNMDFGDRINEDDDQRSSRSLSIAIDDDDDDDDDDDGETSRRPSVSTSKSMNTSRNGDGDSAEEKSRFSFGNIRNLARQLVSKKKVRYQQDGFDLDLTYITPTIVAMGFPSEGRESLYRNKMSDVQQFLQTKHPHKHKVYNLCSERDYPLDRFERCAVYPFDDHNPCPFQLILQFCQDASQFLKQDPEHTVFIHCKAGKGRTGLMVSALLLFLNECSTAPEALEFYGVRRTSNSRGVTIASQARFVIYFEYFLKFIHRQQLTASFAFSGDKIIVTGITLKGRCDFDAGGGCDPYFHVTDMNGIVVYNYKKVVKKVENYQGDRPMALIEAPFAIQGETKFTFYDQDTIGQDEYMFHFWLHTSFHSGITGGQGEIILTKDDLDGSFATDKKCKNIGKDFSICIYYKVNDKVKLLPL